MSLDIPEQLYENLYANEEVKRVLKTTSLLNIPEYTFLTERRIIYFNQKIFGRFDVEDIPYSRLAVMKAERGRMIWSSLYLEGEDGAMIGLKRVPKEEMEDFVMALELAINNVAVEPIRIKRSKGLMGKMTWEFKKTAEMIFKSRAPETTVLQSKSQINDNVSADPLKELKMRLVRGEISKEEYNELKEILE